MADPDHAGDIVAAVTREDIDEARAMLRHVAIRTPLIPMAGVDDRTILLKPECIQPYGSFKIRCGAYAVLSVRDDQLARGLYTMSAGNFGQGVALAAAKRGLTVRVYAPDGAARTKIEAMRALGADVIEVPFAHWWRLLTGEVPDGERAFMVHPCKGREVIVGNATIAAEILEDAPDIDAILVPFGGGGLTLGIAAGVRLLAPHVRVIACEAASSTPLTAARRAGAPVAVDSAPTFIDGIGGAMVLPTSWDMLRRYVADTVVVPDDDAARMVATLLRRHRLVAEGAGAVPVAAGLTAIGRGGKAAAIISGGNIDEHVLTTILEDHPEGAGDA